MKCNFDGSCTESVTQESCGCNGNAMYLQGTMNFQVDISSIVLSYLWAEQINNRSCKNCEK